MSFSIGRDTGFLYFPDAPFFCRRCSTYGHIQESCSSQPTCRRCNETGHIARDCKNQVKCDACGEDGHVLRECRARTTPRSFAQVTAVRPATPAVVAEAPIALFWCLLKKLKKKYGNLGLEKALVKALKNVQRGFSSAEGGERPDTLQLQDAEEGAECMETSVHLSDPEYIEEFCSDDGGESGKHHGGGSGESDGEKEDVAPQRKAGVKKSRWSESGEVSGSETSHSLQMVEDDGGGTG
ncbi:unnamed protein product [Ranitomeya imitator]|uniref:CCHC-type domain-containing protein n=1 Tax=Ranitomeya imitator TaxID=111125 RepID=A0ABN9M156_9NEOB|nr:unnamed protein product [Ranitomeya imitator]